MRFYHILRPSAVLMRRKAYHDDKLSVCKLGCTCVRWSTSGVWAPTKIWAGNWAPSKLKTALDPGLMTCVWGKWYIAATCPPEYYYVVACLIVISASSQVWVLNGCNWSQQRWICKHVVLYIPAQRHKLTWKIGLQLIRIHIINGLYVVWLINQLSRFA